MCQAAKRDNLKKILTRDTVRKILKGQVGRSAALYVYAYLESIMEIAWLSYRLLC